MTAHVFAKLEDVLTAIVAMLIAGLPDQCNEATCFLALDPWERPASNPGDFVFVVAPGAGVFDQGMLEGGGELQATADATVTVVIHSPLTIDEPQRETSFLTDGTLGILGIVRQVLKTLTNKVPVSAAPVNLTRDPLLPANYDFRRSDKSLGSAGLMFNFSFDWDLS